MDHIRVFASLINILLSLLALVCIRSLIRDRKSPLLLFLLLLIGAHILYDLRAFIYNYIDVNIETVFPSRAVFSFQLFWILPQLITWFRRSCLLRISGILLERDLPLRLWLLQMLTGLGLIVFFAAWLLRPGLHVYADTADIVFRIALGLIEAMTMIAVLIGSGRAAGPEKRDALRAFALIGLLEVVFFALFTLFGQNPGQSLALRLIFDFLYRVFHNAALLTWLWFFLRPWIVQEQMTATVADIAGQAGNLGLSHREQEIMELMLLGSSNQVIADKLFISEHTIKNAITNIYLKLGVKNRKELFHRFLVKKN